MGESLQFNMANAEKKVKKNMNGILWEPGQQVLRTERNWLGKDGKTNPIPAEGHIKLEKLSEPAQRGSKGTEPSQGKAQNQWARSAGTTVLGPCVVPQVKGSLHGL